MRKISGGEEGASTEKEADPPLTQAHNGALCNARKNTPFMRMRTEAIPLSDTHWERRTASCSDHTWFVLVWNFFLCLWGLGDRKTLHSLRLHQTTSSCGYKWIRNNFVMFALIINIDPIGSFSGSMAWPFENAVCLRFVWKLSSFVSIWTTESVSIWKQSAWNGHVSATWHSHDPCWE